MRSRAVSYKVKSNRWELTALTGAFAMIFVSVAALIYIIFRAAAVVDSHKLVDDTMLYAETHIFVVLVEIVLWMVIARAAVRFKAYTRSIRSGADGRALDSIANAMLLSLVYAILFGMASTFKTMYLDTEVFELVTTMTNLLPLAMFVIVSIMLFVGTWRLNRLVPGSETLNRRKEQIISFSVALFALVVVPFAQYFYRTSPKILDDDGLRHFALSPGKLALVYLVPFALVWLLGIISSVNLAHYADGVAGKIYRPMFRSLYLGILLAYISTYLVQIWYVSNIPSNNFGPGLFILIGLITMLTFGYGLIYRGANQLYTLEK